MDIAKVQSAIKRVIRRHAPAFTAIGASQSKLLELASITGFAEHYKAQNFEVRVHNPKGKAYFAVKTSTNGDPWNFSHFTASNGVEDVELHMNVKVRSAHDVGMYCVDVGVVKAGSVPKAKPDVAWACLPNADLVSSGGAKKLVVYPMLLAQFIGIVHEIKPAHLAAVISATQIHPPPTLIALGHYSGNARAIVQAYPARGIHVNIAENYDVRLSRVRSAGMPTSPFFGNEV